MNSSSDVNKCFLYFVCFKLMPESSNYVGFLLFFSPFSLSANLEHIHIHHLTKQIGITVACSLCSSCGQTIFLFEFPGIFPNKKTLCIPVHVPYKRFQFLTPINLIKIRTTLHSVLHCFQVHKIKKLTFNITNKC